MPELSSVPVKDVVTSDHRTAAIFEKYSIDFCCNGGLTIDAACAQRGVDPAVVIGELTALGTIPGKDPSRPDSWPLDRLTDHIVSTHHAYVRRMMPVIGAHVDKIVSVHGARHPELSDIARHVRAVMDELASHMQKEEMILFPYIRSLVAAENAGQTLQAPPFGSIRNPIRMMEREHQSAGDALFHVREASGGYTAPSDACTTYRVTYKELEEFELDLHQHVHLENNLLFPRAITLEERLRSGLRAGGN